MRSETQCETQLSQNSGRNQNQDNCITINIQKWKTFSPVNITNAKRLKIFEIGNQLDSNLHLRQKETWERKIKYYASNVMYNILWVLKYVSQMKILLCLIFHVIIYP